MNAKAFWLSALMLIGPKAFADFAVIESVRIPAGGDAVSMNTPLDAGVGVDEPKIGPQTEGGAHPLRAHKWGPDRKDHTDYMLYAGRGKPITFNYHDTGGKSGAYLDNEGSMPVRVFALP